MSDLAKLTQGLGEAVACVVLPDASEGNPSIERAIAAAGRLDNVARYDAELNRMELVPTADDYNAIFEMLGGGPYRAPRKEGR